MIWTVPDLDISSAGGGLRRMMDRFLEEGTLTGDPEEDKFLREHPEAALLGLLFDQRVRAEYAFMGPKRLFDRLGHLDMARIAEMELGELSALFAQPLAVHRFTNMMAKHTQKVARHLVDHYQGEVVRLWNDGADVATLHKRLLALPGFGRGKAAKIKYVLHFLGYRDFSDES
ncbi:MAG: hypothetical protein OXI38_03600 [Bacteroidota bacterium]|nr:hypothetical protein [Bacteroidota bacterium]